MEKYYQILGLNFGATQDEIKKSFRRLAHVHHPDKGGDEKEFKKINQAYQILTGRQQPPQQPIPAGFHVYPNPYSGVYYNYGNIWVRWS